MSIFDVRSSTNDVVDRIVFAEESWDAPHAIEKGAAGGGFYFTDESDNEIHFSNKEALDLIKALQKAVDLGWIKPDVAPPKRVTTPKAAKK